MSRNGNGNGNGNGNANANVQRSRLAAHSNSGLAPRVQAPQPRQVGRAVTAADAA